MRNATIAATNLHENALRLMTKEKPQHGLRIAWIVESVDYDSASFRYRCLIPARFLETRGFRSSFYVDLSKFDVHSTDIIVFVKTFGPAQLDLLESAKKVGKLTVLDLCDNILAPGYWSRRFADAPEYFRHMRSLADAVVVSSPALARVMTEIFPDGPYPIIIPDAALGPIEHWLLRSWFLRCENIQDEIRPDKFRHYLRNFFFTFRRTKYYMRHPQSMMNRFLDGSSDTGALRRRRIIWFGKHGTNHSDAGMKMVLKLLPYLEDIQCRVPLELVIISNNRAKFDAHFHKLPVPTRYRRWSNEAVYEEMVRADVFVMPNAADSFSAAKSANRALLALACDVPVIADKLEALEPLRSAIVIDDWKFGLRRYLLDPAARAKDIALAHKILDREFAPKVIGATWENLSWRLAHSCRHKTVE